MSQSEKIQERSQADKKYTWAINDIYLNDQAWKNDYNEVKKCIPIISSYKGKLSDSSESLYSYLKLNDKITVLFDNLINYAHRKRDEDNRNSVYQEMCGQLSALISEVSDVSSFEIPEILNIDDSTLDKFYSENAELGMYQTYLNRLNFPS